MGRRRRVELPQTFPQASVLVILGGIRLQGKTRSRREQLQGSLEVHPLFLHDKGEEISPRAASTKTMPGLGLREDDKRGGLLLMERAQRFVVLATAPQGHIRADDIDDVQPLFDILHKAHDTPPSTGLYERACRHVNMGHVAPHGL